MTNLERALREAIITDEKKALLLAKRTGAAEEWGISLSTEEEAMLNVMSTDVLELLLKAVPKNPHDKFTICLQAILAKAASSEDFLAEVLKQRGKIAQIHGFEIPEHERAILDSIPEFQIRVMVGTMKKTRREFLSNVTQLLVGTGVGLAIVAIVLGPVLGGSIQTISYSLGHRLGQTVEDFEHEKKVMAIEVKGDLSGMTRDQVLEAVRGASRCQIYLSPRIKTRLDGKVEIKGKTVGEILREVFKPESTHVYYANSKILVN